MKRPWIFAATIVGVLSLTCNSFALAGVADLRIRAGGISVSPTAIQHRASKIYVSVENVGTDDVEASAVYYDNGVQIGTKPMSIRANGAPEEMWVLWTPNTAGEHRIAISIVLDGGDATPANNSGDIIVNVEADTDYDGIPDSIDPDDDNDGVSDVQEIAKGTDPFRTDTDGDGFDDLRDAFPLDRNRWLPPVVIVPAVVVPAKPSPVAPKTVAKHVAPTPVRTTNAVKTVPDTKLVTAIVIDTSASDIAVTTTLIDPPLSTSSTEATSTITQATNVGIEPSILVTVEPNPPILTMPRIAWGFAGLCAIGAGLFYILHRRSTSTGE